MTKFKKLLNFRYLKNSDLSDNKGFTIVETSVAIAIFGFLIIFCLSTFIFVSRIYYKGLYENETQEVARNIVDNIAEAIRTSGAEVKLLKAVKGPMGDPDVTAWRGYCIGNIQYSYRLNTQLNLGLADTESVKNQANKVFIVSRICKEEADPPVVGASTENQSELLRDRMRILHFSVDQIGDSSLYSVRLKLAHGGDASDLETDKTFFEDYVDVVDYKNTVSSPPAQCLSTPDDKPECFLQIDYSYYDDYMDNDYIKKTTATTPKVNSIPGKCKSDESFCAVIEFETKVFRKVL